MYKDPIEQIVEALMRRDDANGDAFHFLPAAVGYEGTLINGSIRGTPARIDNAFLDYPGFMNDVVKSTAVVVYLN